MSPRRPAAPVAWRESPIDLPEAECDGVRISHRVYPAGSELPVIGMRQALLRGLRPVMAKLAEPLRVHALEAERGTWMTDLPEELQQIAEAIAVAAPWGRVCVGGLGLGILPRILADYCLHVEEVVVVERDPRIISLTARPGYEVVEGDIAEYLRTCDPFDTYMLDTWQGTSESDWWHEVMPLRRTIAQRWGSVPDVWCWAEDIMRGQVERALQQGKNHWFYKGLPAMTLRQARHFLRTVGLPAWERKWGHLFPAQPGGGQEVA